MIKNKQLSRKGGARQRILDYLRSKFPQKVNTKDLEKVAKISDYQRRIRELRAEGWVINTHHDDPELRTDEYRLASLERRTGYRFSKQVSGRVRAFVLQRNGFTCSACGRGVDDEDPTSPGRNVRLNIDHIDPNGPSTAENLRVLCSACNQGKQDLILAQGSVDLLRAVRRASRAAQHEVYIWLKGKFDTTT